MPPGVTSTGTGSSARPGHAPSMHTPSSNRNSAKCMLHRISPSRVVPNDWRLQRFVYHQTRDFMRRVSRHVSIGAAFTRERPLDHYFVLCRRD